MENLDFNEESAEELLDFFGKKIQDATYISLLLFKDQTLLRSINNNYNNWRDVYSHDDMKHDDVFYEISHQKIKKSNQAICFWNSVPHQSEGSLGVDHKRKENGLFNGMTMLLWYSENYTLGINITSNANIQEDEFYSKVILCRKIFFEKLKCIVIAES